ncbi:MBOAT family O-acyltransferase [Pseudomonas eucalypticola]|uniref:Probable alginate O-acetylase n=1 Tax=Pseudomonas eucalypticola TaxID=2599595 RepID=A0A7D5H3M0_9PSED|nr:MBOAT family O-acyltransferase [Pseudomonas eucalypticola]QKZ03063.1 MBOAT family protein [Pseudomonas eucalypticola]
MSYFSIEFGLCFILFFLLYWCLNFSLRVQNVLLLAASYAILASFNLTFLYVLLGYSAAVFALGQLSARYPGRRFTYGAILALVLGCFYFFKYQDFFATGFQQGLQALGVDGSLPIWEVLLPVGMSFYIFHSVSYLMAINRGTLKPAAPLDLALYLAFFPSLIAGPVNRAEHLLPQINPSTPRQVLEPQRALGLVALAVVKLFLFSTWLANHWVDPVFDTPSGFSPEQILLSIYGYSLQIYFNFSGYTNLVTGIALLLGFRLPRNFDYPYLARNLKEFWDRWHISLSTFIRDYIYIPLGGNRKGYWRGNLNLFLAMVISGLWHGASVNFLIWGALHGVGLIAYKLYARAFPSPRTWPGADLLARLLTFHYVAFAWIFFRSATLEDTQDMLVGLSHLSFDGLAQGPWVGVLACLALIAVYPWLVSSLRQAFAASRRIPWLVYPIPLGLFISLVIFASPSGVPGFIYASF